MHVKSGVAQPEDAGRLSSSAVWMNIVEKGTEQMQCEPRTQHPHQTNVAYVLSCAVVVTYATVHTEKHKNIRNKNLTLV